MDQRYLPAMNVSQSDQLQTLLTEWVHQSHELRALALCGSWARGDARADSDADLLVLMRNPSQSTAQLIENIAFERAGFKRQSLRWETYGVVQSAHITLHPNAELELSFASINWASCAPIDPGTRQVVTGGFKVLVDKDGLLNELLAALGTG
ncbi:MAG: nucleotidyltransferase domain-containing protein [Alphaproteobacteria bacterium]|nr:nucleotidyltransferase domain-containing protein [Alphaproteobacteria bacterium]